MADRSGYIGRAPGDSSVIIARQTFAPVAITTDFTFASGYTPGYVDVYVDGLRKLVGTDYSATDGSVVSILNGGVSVGSTAVVVAYKAFNVANPISNIGSGSLSVGTDLTVGDIVTINGATQSSSKDTGAIICEGGVGIEKNLFVGGGAEVTGILTVTNTLDANGALDVDGHTELDDVNVSGAITATTFTGNLTGTAGGLSGSPNITINNLVGVAATFSGVVTYEDVTNIDSVGIITAQSGLRVVGGGLTVTGVSTFFSNVGINTDSPTENLSVNGNVVFGHDQLAGNPGSTIGIATVRGHHVNSDADYAELYFANSKSSGGSTASIRAGREGDNGGNNLTFYTQQSGGSFGNGSEKLRITSGGNVSIQNDSGKFTAGASDDLEIYHTGTGAYIQNKTGTLYIGSNFDDDDGGDIRIQPKYGENSIVAFDDGSVELYYDNSKKFETTSTGITVTGTCAATSFSGDGSGLSGVGGDTDITSCLFI